MTSTDLTNLADDTAPSETNARHPESHAAAHPALVALATLLGRAAARELASTVEAPSPKTNSTKR